VQLFLMRSSWICLIVDRQYNEEQYVFS
jgi:hypothetical protein